MKILRLNLKAFGPFTDRELDLSAGDEGLHLLYGANEAGKSTTLRALEQLFFGMPERSGDEFLHPSSSLRLGATLRHSDGSELTFWRRRGRKVTLYAADDRTPLDAAELDRFLGKLDSSLFTSMFGLNRTTLEKAGQEIVRGGGQLGQVLFAAASGIADLRGIQENLETELGELFKPAGKKPRINVTLSELRDARERIKQHQLPGEQWIQHDSALRQAQMARQQLEKELSDVEREERRWTRFRDALPVLARRREVLAALEPLAGVPRLPADFADRRRRAEAMLAALQLDQLERHLAEAESQLAEARVPEDLLAQAGAIDDVYRRLGGYQKARAELPGLEEELHRHASAVERLGLPLGDTPLPALRPEDLALVRKLALEQRGLRARSDAAQIAVERLTRSTEETQQELARLATPGDVEPLRRAVRQVQREGPLEDEWNSLGKRAELADQHTQRLLEQLPGFSGSIERLLTLPIPPADGLDRYQDLLRESQGRLDDLAAQVRLDAVEVDALARELAAFDADAPLPTPDDLAEARRIRDEGWHHVRRAWLEGSTDDASVEFVRAQSADSLDAAFERALHAADACADRLHDAADRIARRGELVVQLEERRRQHDSLCAEQAAAEERATQARAEWQDLLRPLGVELSPRELRAWLARYHGVVQQATQARELRDKAEQLRVRLDQHVRQLAECLRPAGVPTEASASVAFLVGVAQPWIEEQDALVRQRQNLERDLTGKRRDLDQARADQANVERDLARWATHWSAAMERIGKEPSTPPEAATTYLESVQKLLEAKHAYDQVRARVERVRRETEAYAQQVQTLARTLGRDGSETIRTVTDLHAALVEGRRLQVTRQGLEETHRKQTAQLAQARRTRDEQLAARAELCDLAGCKEAHDLPAVEAQAQQRAVLEREQSQLERHLDSLRGDVPLAEFAEQVKRVDIERLDAELAQQSERRQQLAHRLQEIDQTIGEERKALADMDGTADAARAAEEVQFLLARLQTDARAFAVRRLALAILQESIERYRDKSEGQIVKRASELFSLLTLGGFDSLSLDTDDKHETVLCGIRSGDRQVVKLEGMSDGTRDQLYLALRLASLEVYLDAHEPIPFVVDDLLLNIDDARAAAALEALGQLSRRTQVLFFTHNEHFVRLAQETLPAGVLHVHQLPPARLVGTPLLSIREPGYTIDDSTPTRR